MSKKDVVNVYLNSQEKENHVLKDASPHEKYILLQNDTLHSQIREFTEENLSLTTKVEEMEEDIDRSQIRATNLKGLLKNLHEINKKYQNIEGDYKNIVKKMRTDNYGFKYKATRHLRVLEALLFCFLLICYENYSFIQFLPICCSVFITVAFQESTLMNLPSFVYKEIDQIKDHIQFIKDIEKAQDYLHEFIDNQ